MNINDMTTETLIQGIREIQSGLINSDAIIDMAPLLIKNLQLLILQDQLQPIIGNDFVYICGKITGLHRSDYLRNFKEAEQMLRMAGYNCINPTTIVPETSQWNIAMRICLNHMVNHCNKIYLMPDWHDSRGAIIEKNIAENLGFQFITNETLITQNHEKVSI